MAQDGPGRHDRMGYSVANPSNEELVAVEEAGLDSRREREDDKHQQ